MGGRDRSRSPRAALLDDRVKMGSANARRRKEVSDLESHMLSVFRPMESSKVEDMVDRACRDFVESTTFCTPDVTEQQIAQRFERSDIPEHPTDTTAYFRTLMTDVVEDSIHTSSPQMIGHMTSALPNYSTSLAKLMVAMNQNVVKIETAKTVTFLERQALGMLHRLIFQNTEAFYKEHVQNPASMLGLLTTGGTLANTSALWIARNKNLGPAEDGSFEGVEREGLLRALRHHGYEDFVVLGSDLMHYSLDKAADILGMGVKGLVKVPVNRNYQVDLGLMEAKILEMKKSNILICAIVGICGTTETGAIDDLRGMAGLATKYNIHFHVDAAWGGPCVFSRQHRHKAAGIELADSVTLDGHKQLWVPMGVGMVFLKDPRAVDAVSKTANYIIRKDSYDSGKFTIDGSRGAGALYLHANLQLLGLRGYEVLFDRTVRMARYMARCVLRSQNWELLLKPMTNILLYRWIPASLRKKVWNQTLTDKDNEVIDECNRQLQSHQKNRGRTFVSRTTINAPKYDHKPIVALRVVIGNPLTSESDIDAVFWDQDAIIMSDIVTKDHTSNPEAVIPRDVGVPLQEDAPLEVWDAVWKSMPPSQRTIFSNDIDTYYDAMITPDCFLDPKKREAVMQPTTP